MLVRIDPYYHPTTRERYFQELVRAQRDADRIRRRRRMRRRQWRRERLFQGMVASQRDADRIARKRRLERKRRRREHLYPWLLVIAAAVCLLIGIIDWEAIL